MFDYEIRKLNYDFYTYYSQDKYPEILIKRNRVYDIVIFKVEFLKNYYVCVPFRSEMRHNNGYRFRYSKRSRIHFSGLDFSKLIILRDETFIDETATIDFDEYEEFERNKEFIHKKLEKYIFDYINHYKGIKILKQRDFNRKYQYSTLKYFHKELGI